MAIALSTLWILFIWSIIAVELVMLNSSVWSVIGLVAASLLILLNGYFVYYYNKNKKKIMDLQRQYIDTLKPDKPLRFCPSDDELMKRHIEQKSLTIEENNAEQNGFVEEENTQEENEELENF